LYDQFGVDPKLPLVLYAGRLAPEKGLDYVLETVSEVEEAHPDVQYLILGGGEMADSLARSVADRDLDAVSVVMDKQPYAAMPAIHSMASVFVYPPKLPIVGPSSSDILRPRL